MRIYEHLTKLPHSIWYDRCGLCLLCFFALSCFWDAANGNYALVFLLLWWLLDPRNIKEVWWREPVFWWSIAFSLYLALHTFVIELSPDLAAKPFSEAEKLAKSGFLFSLPLAAGLHRWKPFWGYILILCAAGVFLHMIENWEQWYRPDLIDNILNQPFDRLSFAYSATNLGLWCTLILLFLVLPPLRPFWSSKKIKSWKICTWIIVTIIFFIMLLATKTRGAWITLAIICPIILFIDFIKQFSIKKSLTTTLLLIISIIILLQVPYIKQRITYEKDALIKIMRGNFKNIHSESYGLRIDMYQLFFEKAAKKPLLGYGIGTSQSLLHKSGIQRPHFHNSLFEIQIQIGLIGIVLFFGFWFIVLRTLLNKFLHERNNSWPLLICAELVAFAFFALTHDPLGSQYGPFILALLAGFAISFKMENAAQYKYQQQLH